MVVAPYSMHIYNAQCTGHNAQLLRAFGRVVMTIAKYENYN